MLNIQLTHDEVEVLYDVAVNVHTYVAVNDIAINSRALPSISYYLACEFQELHQNTDWTQLDYLETVDDFVDKEAKQLLEMEEEDLWLLTAQSKIFRKTQ